MPRTGEADHDPAWMLINRRVLVAQHSFQKPTDGQRFSAGAVVILPRDDHDDDHDDDGDNYASSGSGSGSGGGGGDDHAQGERKETAVATVHGTTTTTTTTHFALTCPETGAHMRTARLRASIRLAALAQLVSMNRKCTIGFGWLAPLCDRRLFAVTPDCRVGSPRQADDDDPNETPPLRACYCTAPERVWTRIEPQPQPPQPPLPAVSPPISAPSSSSSPPSASPPPPSLSPPSLSSAPSLPPELLAAAAPTSNDAVSRPHRVRIRVTAIDSVMCDATHYVDRLLRRQERSVYS